MQPIRTYLAQLGGFSSSHFYYVVLDLIGDTENESSLESGKRGSATNYLNNIDGSST